VTPQRTSIPGAGGVEIGLVTEGSGPPVLLVHGGMNSANRWASVWPLLTEHYRVTAMDRRGRGASGDASDYALADEYGDVLAVAEYLTADHPDGVDVLAHSIGAVCALGAAGRGAPFRRLALYEPPGPDTVDREWIERAGAWLDDGQTGRAVVSFLVEIIGLDPEAVSAMRDTPIAAETLPIATRTLRREAEALSSLDLSDLTRGVRAPVMFLLGEHSPAWAAGTTARLHEDLPTSSVVELPGQGHDAVDTAPALVVSRLRHFFDAG
jgi:pimeloyl-ACP methyl ester carboxylesterase